MISYILSSVALFHLGRREGVKAYGLAWVPGFRDYVLGGIADKADAAYGKPDRKFRTFMLLFAILAVLVAAVIIFLAVLFSGELSKAVASFGEAGNSIAFDIDSAEELLKPGAVWPSELSELGGILLSGSLIMLIPALAVLGVLSAAFTALKWVCLYKVYDLCKPSAVMGSLILAAVFPGLIAAIVLFAKKNYRNDRPEEYSY